MVADHNTTISRPLFKKTLKFFGKTLLYFLGFVALYLLIGFCLSKITVHNEPNAPDEMAIYILTNGVHTDIVMPVKTPYVDWSERLPFQNTVSANKAYTYIAMGWGDKGFYLQTPTWGDLKFSVAFKAATGLSSTAMHTTYYRSMRVGDSCKKIMISHEQYQKLVAHISGSFRKDSNGNFINIETDAQYGNADAFYEANGSYSMLTTCNTWANTSLKVIGEKACLWTAFDSGIFEKHQ